MAAPTQELPPWYTIWTTTLTNNAGEPTQTTTTLLYLPLTYYGPSIPLNADWTYGGLTPPSSSAATVPPPVPSNSGSAPPTLTSFSAIPTSPSSAIPSQSSNGLPPSASENIPSTIQPSTPPSSSPSAPPPPVDTNALSQRNRNIAIIVGAIFGFLFLVSVACLLFCWLTRYRKRSISSHSHTRLSDEDYDFVPPSLINEAREAGDGSPRHSGEEADPFLRPHSTEMGQVRPRVGFLPTTNIMRDSVSSHPQTLNTLTNTSTTGSGYGNVIPSPYSNEPFDVIQRHEREHQEMIMRKQRGHILSPDDIRRISNENVSRPWASNTPHSLPVPPGIRAQPPPEPHHDDNEDDSSPLIPPPPTSYRAERTERAGRDSTTPSSYATLDQEPGELLTAQRVSTGHPTIRALPPQPRSGPSSWRDKLPFFRDSDSSSSKASNKSLAPSTAGILSTVADSGSYQPLDSEVSGSASRRPNTAPAAGTTRPISGMSGTSGGTGGTVYYDARSTPDNSERSGRPSRSGTPLNANELGAITPLPRAAGPGYNPLGSYIPPVPPIPAQYDQSSGGDILDAPVPSAVPFRMPAKPSGAYVPAKNPFIPPGLQELLDSQAAPMFDVLEDEPPRAMQPWKAMSQKSTFGRFTPTRPRHSPAASDSPSQRSTGSGHLAPPQGHSRVSPSLQGSGSSRGTHSSLAHSGSVSSQGVRRHGHQHMSTSSSMGYRGPISPAVSAFGPIASPSPVPTPPPQSHLPPRQRLKSDTDLVDGAYPSGPTTMTSGSTDRDSETLVTPDSLIGRENLDDFPDVPWAGGLDSDWKPVSPTSSTFPLETNRWS